MGHLLRAILVLPVSDMHVSTAWYQSVLQLETVYVYEGEDAGEVANYAILQRDEVSIHLTLDEGYSAKQPQNNHLYVYTEFTLIQFNQIVVSDFME